jgi:hypothetical protein
MPEALLAYRQKQVLNGNQARSLKKKQYHFFSIWID